MRETNKRPHSSKNNRSSAVYRAIEYTRQAVDRVAGPYWSCVDPLDIPIIMGDHRLLTPADLVAMKKGAAHNKMLLWFATIFQTIAACRDLINDREFSKRQDVSDEMVYGNLTDTIGLRAAIVIPGFNRSRRLGAIICIPPTVGAEGDWLEESGIDDRLRVPYSVWLTAQATMLIRRLDTALVYRLSEHGVASSYTINLDRSGQAGAVRISTEFWTRFMELGEAAVPLARDSSEVIRGDITMGIRTLRATNQQLTLLASYRAAQREIAAQTANMSEIAEQISKGIGDNNVLLDPISGKPLVVLGPAMHWASSDEIIREASKIIDRDKLRLLREKSRRVTPHTMAVFQEGGENR